VKILFFIENTIKLINGLTDSVLLDVKLITLVTSGEWLTSGAPRI